jgi:PAS domain S-box-containing protein
MTNITRKIPENIWISIIILFLLSGTIIQAYLTDIKSRSYAQALFHQTQDDFIEKLSFVVASHEGSTMIEIFETQEFQRLVESKFPEDISIEVFSDLNTPNESLIYSLNEKRDQDFRYYKKEISTRSLDFSEQKIYIQFETLPEYGKNLGRYKAILILIFGVGMSIAIFIILFAFRNAKQRAELITAERTLELAKSEKQFRSALTYSPIGMTLVSSTGKFLTVNKALCQITGYNEKELLALDFQTITHEDDLDKDLDYFNQMKAGEIDSYEMEKRYYHKKGHLIWVQLNVSMVRKPNGEIEYFISQIQNITKRKEIEESLRMVNAELEEFSYRTSHDLRSPLKSSIGLLTMASQSLKFEEYQKAEKCIDHVQTSLEKLEALVEDILLLTQTKNLEEEDELLNIGTLIPETVQSFAHMDHFDRLDIQFELAYDSEIMTKPSRIKLIVENLISNAIKYQDIKKQGSFIKISTQTKGKNFILSVEDNGLGIPKDQQENMFQMFKRFHPKASFGSGLGLYMVKKSADILEGQIDYDGAEGQSKFTLTMPFKTA